MDRRYADRATVRVGLWRSLAAMAAGLTINFVVAAEPVATRSEPLPAIRAAQQVIDREEIERSGAISLADLLRKEAVNVFGTRRPVPFSENSSVLGANIHGLGGQYTLVLIDGRRLMPSVSVNDEQNLNAIPLAAIERVELLSGGASAIYGSDAVAGVINVVTRRAFEGVIVSLGAGAPQRRGGDTEEGSMIYGSSSDVGSVMAGAAWANRDLVASAGRSWSRDGFSTFSNNFLSANPRTPFPDTQYSIGGLLNNPTFGSVVPGAGGCSGESFFVNGPRCLYRFADLSTEDPELRQQSLFAKSRRQLGSDWSLFLDASVARTHSFGQQGPSSSATWPGFRANGFLQSRGAPLIPVGSPNHPAIRFPNAGYDPTRPVFLRHRFAGVGPVTTQADSVAYSALAGAAGRVGALDIEFAIGLGEDDYTEFNRNVVIAPLAQALIADGSYDIYDPYGNSRSVLDSIAATTSRDASLKHEQAYLRGGLDVFQLAGGAARLTMGLEGRQESLLDRYDTLQTAGLSTRSRGLFTSAGADGDRDVRALSAQLLLPVSSSLSLEGALRYDDYSDIGSETSARLAVAYQPSESLRLYAAGSRDFNAPGLAASAAIGSQTEFNFQGSCLSDPFPGSPFPVLCGFDFPALLVVNPSLEAEQADQWNAGFHWQPADWIAVGLDLYDIEIDRRLRQFGIGDVIQCAFGIGTAPCPASVTQISSVVPNPSLGLGAAGDRLANRIDFVQYGLVNLGKLELSGADLSIRTDWDFEAAGAIDSTLRVSRVQSYRIDGGDNLTGNASLPRWRATLKTRWEIDNFVITWNVQHIEGTGSQAALIGDTFFAQTLPSWTTHDLQFAWSSPWRSVIRLGVSNIADQNPPLESLGLLGADYDFNLYDGYGRTPYLRVTQSF